MLYLKQDVHNGKELKKTPEEKENCSSPRLQYRNATSYVKLFASHIPDNMLPLTNETDIWETG